MSEQYFSEHYQDQWLAENIFGLKANGVFFEAGALDGLLHSNTLFFERYRSWVGVLVEANPALAGLAAAHRPHSRCFTAALWDHETEILFENYSTGLLGWSGVPEVMDPKHLERVSQSIPAAQRFTTKIQTSTITQILNIAGVSHVDYMSLDVEGSELKALQGLDFNHISVDILGVENNFDTPEIGGFLNKIGYQKFHRQGVDDFYRRT